MSMFVAGIKASLDTASLSIPQGRSGDIPVSISSLGRDGTDASFDLYDSVTGITVTNTTVDVAAGQTVRTSLHVVVARGAPLGDENYNLAVSGFRPTIGLGSLTLTVTPLPMQSVAIPLGAAADAWNAARSAAWDTIKDLTGQQVLPILAAPSATPTAISPPCR